MNKDEIIDMANKAGFDLTMWQLSLGCEVSGTHDELLAFAKLVAEAEREACAKVCETFDQREMFNDEDMAVADACATAIRARGQA